MRGAAQWIGRLALCCAILPLTAQQDPPRWFTAIGQIANLQGPEKTTQLRSLLATWWSRDLPYLKEALFIFEKDLRAPLRDMLHDPDPGPARELLAFFADADDMAALVETPIDRTSRVFENRWLYSVVCALIDPQTEQEWELLRASASGEANDGWVDSGAIQSLRLNGTSRSREILLAARQKNLRRVRMIDAAIAYIDSSPNAMQDVNLASLVDRVARTAVHPGDWERTSKPSFNASGDKAFVHIIYSAPTDEFVWRATFHKVGGVWRLRVIQEVLQALVIRSRGVKAKESPALQR